jgi:hypothetical protein
MWTLRSLVALAINWRWEYFLHRVVLRTVGDNVTENAFWGLSNERCYSWYELGLISNWRCWIVRSIVDTTQDFIGLYPHKWFKNLLLPTLQLSQFAQDEWVLKKTSCQFKYSFYSQLRCRHWGPQGQWLGKSPGLMFLSSSSGLEWNYKDLFDCIFSSQGNYRKQADLFILLCLCRR